MTRAYLGLGSNLGDREALLAAALEALDWGDVRVVERSRIYDTDPIGGPAAQPTFLNQVVAVETSLDARELWDRCSAVEAALGRSRLHEERWGPRPVDIDLLLFGDAEVDEHDLVIPHPRMCERAFVLVPLLEIAPDVVVPGRGPAREALEDVGGQGVRPVEAGG